MPMVLNRYEKLYVFKKNKKKPWNPKKKWKHNIEILLKKMKKQSWNPFSIWAFWTAALQSSSFL